MLVLMLAIRKGLIERSSIDGQKVYHSDLDKAMRMYIQEHQSEFIPAGIDPTAVAPIEPLGPLVELTYPALLSHSLEATCKAHEHERNRLGLQWAYETFDGAYGVAKRSTFGALDLVKEGIFGVGSVFGGSASSGGGAAGSGGSVHLGHVGDDWKSEVDAITTTLNAVEERARFLRESLNALN
jgi:hypothetical protein